MKVHEAVFLKSCARVSDCPPDGLPEVAVVGRSNVGKSSLLNNLLGHRGLARVSGTPGKTRLINFFKVAFGPPPFFRGYFVDLPGYGYAKVSQAERAGWASLVENYLRHRDTLRGVVMLLDIRHDPSPLDLQLLDWIGHYRHPFLIVVTKSDRLPRGRRAGAVRRIQMLLPAWAADAEILGVSAKTGEGRDAVLDRIVRLLKQ